MSNFVKRIIFEADTPIENLFAEHEILRYAFIWRDVTHFNTIDKKRFIVKILEKYRKKSGNGLPMIEINPQMLVATQDTVDSNNLKKINNKREQIKSAPFVVKLNMVYYLLDGHHRTSSALLNGEKTIKVHYLDLNEVDV